AKSLRLLALPASLPRTTHRARSGRDPHIRGSLRQLLDLALGGVELLGAEAVELLAALPERERLVEAGVAALEPLDDLDELLLGLLVGHSTRAPNTPSATSTAIAVPGETAVALRTSSPSLRTIA